MADLVGLLMLDHFMLEKTALKQEQKGPERMDSIIRFIAECHFEIEENAIFPFIDASIKEESPVRAAIRSCLSDHLLIRKAGKGVVDLISAGDVQGAARKFDQFSKLLIAHDGKEDGDVFPEWYRVESTKSTQALEEAKSIIDQYGINYYERITGLTPRLIKHFLSISK